MTEIEEPQLDSKDQSPGMPRWLIGAMLGIAIYLIVGFVLVQFYNPLFDPRTFNLMSHCDAIRNGDQLEIWRRLFIGFLIEFFLSPLFILGENIPRDTPSYYLTGISIFAVGGAAFSCTLLTKTWRLIIGVVIILAWISAAFIVPWGWTAFYALVCYG